MQLEIAYSPERVARISYYENTAKNFEIALQGVGTDCKKKILNLECKMNNWFSFYVYQATWSKHTDNSYLNKIVKTNLNLINTPIAPIDWTMRYWKDVSGSNLIFSNMIQFTQPTTIYCNHFEWAQNINNEIKEINFETYHLNHETDATDLGIIRSLNNVKFDLSKKRLEYKTMATFNQNNTSNIRYLAAPVISEFVSFTIADRAEKYCHINFKTNTNFSIAFSKIRSVKNVSPFAPLQFLSIQDAFEKLTRQNSDELGAFNIRYRRAKEKLPLEIQLLDTFGLAKITYKNTSEEDLFLEVTVGEVL
jgi:hypothetical protein